MNRNFMRMAAKTVLQGEGVASAEISLAFVDDETSAQINHSFLKHQGPTDVITFPLSEPGARKLVGELVIGGQIAKRVSGERGHHLNAELALYVIHGLLHLCGYDDKKKKARRVMRVREAHYLKILKLPPIAERAEKRASSR